ncbi:hypothetical protein LEM8419_03576 [Neolewinella maritima]|uniref:Uncharacterized protein n=1 Tax=Neolewinella maritima TaxID=1383882 RepID=A0ABM9B5N4_9BACT|nr:hypothetical protein [Neolewinella maritima]CAH1002704.1 hypothetical protein LEM8419_03576 [Neolewinella maritima]
MKNNYWKVIVDRHDPGQLLLMLALFVITAYWTLTNEGWWVLLPLPFAVTLLAIITYPAVRKFLRRNLDRDSEFFDPAGGTYGPIYDLYIYIAELSVGKDHIAYTQAAREVKDKVDEIVAQGKHYQFGRSTIMFSESVKDAMHRSISIESDGYGLIRVITSLRP